MQARKVYHDLKEIFLAAVERVDPYKMIVKHLLIEGNELRISFEGFKQRVDLDAFEQIFVLGAGKATASMARAIEEILKQRITAGIISVKYSESLCRIEVVEAGHPLPDERSVRAAREIEALAERADEKTLVINLISGGGSALLASPMSCVVDGGTIALSLKEKQETTQALLACGATIQEMNCIRKHISQIKGGRLAKLLYPATSLNFILSDVVGDRLDTIASGLTVPDDTTYSEAEKIIKKYGLENKLPEKVMTLIQKGMEGKVEETPKSKDEVFSRVFNILLGTNYIGLQAASAKAEALGYNTALLSSQIIGESREVAKVYAGIARDVHKYNCLVEKPACIIGGGETTVTIRGGGKGGRNQECALSFLAEMQDDWETAENIYFLSASTDGNDGPTDAAGAFASFDVFKKSRELGLSVTDYLAQNDSYNFFNASGYLLKTGPTNTNVCDFQICIVI